MRDRARPAAIFSLMGMACRIGERMGMHRDGDQLGLSVLRSEERRRIWWQLQFLEIATAQVVGTLSISLYGPWDCKLPASLEDADMHPDMQTLPKRNGLTSMSHCLWRYTILHFQRERRLPTGEYQALPWMLSPHVPLTEKDAKIDEIEAALGAMFLQHCELLNPLHVYIQIGIRSLILAARRTARQPGLVNAKISEMSLEERDDFLRICKKCLEYYVLSQTTESLKGFRWHNESYFQGIACEFSVARACRSTTRF